MSDRRALIHEGRIPIEVIMNDGTHHRFMPQVLDVLIENNRVMKFRRSSGWVTVGVDPIRVTGRRVEPIVNYFGPERRNSH